MARIIAECPHCGVKIKPCPFCAAPAQAHGDNTVECSEILNCGANVDWGHWTGTDPKGVPAIHHVIEHWNRRHLYGESK